MKNFPSFLISSVVCCFIFVAGVNAGDKVEIRTLGVWNLPHPFEGPKNLTENIFSQLMHPTVKDYAREKSIVIEYSKEDDCLLIRGAIDDMTAVEESLKQLTHYQHPYVSLFDFSARTGATETVLRFPGICAKSGGINLLRLEVEYLPVVPSKWIDSVRYGMKSSIYPTLGNFRFPKTTTGAKGREIKGELNFLPNKKEAGVAHVLSYQGMSKGDVRSFLNSSGGESRIFLDVPYKQLLDPNAETQAWNLYRTPGRALKFMCPNYNNDRVSELFRDLEFRQILQQAADLVYHTRAVGITDTGLQPVDHLNALALSFWKPFGSGRFNREKQQLENRWRTWLNGKSKNSNGLLGKHFKVENGRRLIDVKTGDLPTFKLFFADNINDSTYFLNLIDFVGEKNGLGILDIQADRADDFITADKFRPILARDKNLSPGHEGVVFDAPIPNNDHLEHYFSKHRNFFGLDEGIAEKTIVQAEKMLTGSWEAGATERMGKNIREEVPCIIVGQHLFFVYIRKEGEFRLGGLPEKVRSSKASAAYKLGRQIFLSAH